jgi:hypothetical protein
MPKMSKTVCRKRLDEAARKILVVWNSRNDNLTKNDLDKLLTCVRKIDEVRNKLK